MAPSKSEREALCRRFIALGVPGIAIMGDGNHDIRMELSVEDAGVALVALETYHAGRKVPQRHDMEQDVRIPDPREMADDLARMKADLAHAKADLQRMTDVADDRLKMLLNIGRQNEHLRTALDVLLRGDTFPAACRPPEVLTAVGLALFNACDAIGAKNYITTTFGDRSGERTAILTLQIVGAETPETLAPTVSVAAESATESALGEIATLCGGNALDAPQSVVELVRGLKARLLLVEGRTAPPGMEITVAS